MGRQVSQEDQGATNFEMKFAKREAGCCEGTKELDGKHVYIGGLVVSTRFLGHRVCAVKNLFLTNNGEELFVHVIDVVVPGRECHAATVPLPLREAGARES